MIGFKHGGRLHLDTPSQSPLHLTFMPWYLSYAFIAPTSCTAQRTATSSAVAGIPISADHDSPPQILAHAWSRTPVGILFPVWTLISGPPVPPTLDPRGGTVSLSVLHCSGCFSSYSRPVISVLFLIAKQSTRVLPSRFGGRGAGHLDFLGWEGS